MYVRNDIFLKCVVLEFAGPSLRCLPELVRRQIVSRTWRCPDGLHESIKIVSHFLYHLGVNDTSRISCGGTDRSCAIRSYPAAARPAGYQFSLKTLKQLSFTLTLWFNKDIKQIIKLMLFRVFQKLLFLFRNYCWYQDFKNWLYCTLCASVVCNCSCSIIHSLVEFAG
jgi:hypothetical protein